MSSSLSPIPSSIINLDNISKYPEINDVILKEKEYLLLINQYNTISKEYSEELKKENPSKGTLQNLLNHLNEINVRLMKYSNDINDIKDTRMGRFRNSIFDKKKMLNNNLEDIMHQLNNEEIELSKIKQRVSDAEGINKEYTKQIRSTNYKYIILLITVVFLVVSIIISIMIPYKTNLESYLFLILIIVVIYYSYAYMKQYKHDVSHKLNTQYGNIKGFLNIN